MVDSWLKFMVLLNKIFGQGFKTITRDCAAKICFSTQSGFALSVVDFALWEIREPYILLGLWTLSQYYQVLGTELI